MIKSSFHSVIAKGAFGLSALFLLLLGCSRGGVDTASTEGLNFSFPKTKSFSSGTNTFAVGEAEHIVLNMRNAASLEILHVAHWDEERDGGIPSFTVPDMPQNTAILIQALGVYTQVQANGEDETAIFYGKTTQTFTDDIANITLELNDNLLSTEPKEYEIAGRFVTTIVSGVPHGPTDRILVSTKPNAADPALELFQEEMIDGWFSVFAFEGIPFTYTLESSGTVIFSELDTPSTVVSGATSTRMEISVPAHARTFDSGSTFDTRDEEGLILGYFGSQSTSSSLGTCYNNSNGSEIASSNLFLADQTTAMQWFGSPSGGGDFLHAHRSSGGLDGSSASQCTGGTEFVTKLTFDESALENGIFDSIPFDGILKRAALTFTDSNCNRTDTIAGCLHSTNQVEVKWNYLPNIFDTNPVSSAKVVGVDIFRKVVSTNTDTDEEGVEAIGDTSPCDEYNTDASFTKTSHRGAAANSLSFTQTIGASEKMAIFVCQVLEVAGVEEYSLFPFSVRGVGNDTGGGGGPSGPLFDFTTGVDTTVFTYPTRADSNTNFTTVASEINGAGDIIFVNSNNPRITHDPETLTPLGVLIEQTSINLLTHSDQFQAGPGGWAVFDSATVDTDVAGITTPAGDVVAERVTDADSGSFANGILNSTVAGTSGPRNYVFSVFVKNDTAAGAASIRLEQTSTAIECEFVFNPNDPDANATQSVGGECSGEGYQKYQNGWTRVWVSVFGTFDTSNLDLRIKPAYNSDFSVTENIASTGAVYVWGAQLEHALTFPTSYIRTSGGQETRGADDLSIANWHSEASLPTFNTNGGAFVVRTRAPKLFASVLPVPIITVHDSTAGPLIIDLAYGVSSHELVVDDTTNSGTINGNANVANQDNVFGMSFDPAGDTFNLYDKQNGGAGYSGGTTPGTVSFNGSNLELKVGHDGTSYLNSTIKSIDYINGVTPIGTLQTTVDGESF